MRQKSILSKYCWSISPIRGLVSYLVDEEWRFGRYLASSPPQVSMSPILIPDMTAVLAVFGVNILTCLLVTVSLEGLAVWDLTSCHQTLTSRSVF